jgi:DNA-directed RNA polymerase specialized sigma24 family protein
MHPSDGRGRERGLQRAVLAGDEQAWKILYDEAFAGLYGYVLWRCGGLRDPTDEVVQETWLTAVRRFAVVRPGVRQLRRLAARHRGQPATEPLSP